LMLATVAGGINIIRHLQEAGADLFLTDNLGRNAFQLALARATDKVYAQKALFKVYQELVPAGIRVKIGPRMVKLHNRQMEFFLLNYMLATQRDMIVGKAVRSIPGFSTDDFLAAVEAFPDQILPAYRKQRTYISAFLSNNEIFRTGKSPTCKGIFYRIHRGYYIVNPVLEIGIGDQWLNFFDDFVRLGELGQIDSHNIRLLKKLFPTYRQAVETFLNGGAQPDPVPE
jgi:hypothetical protein